MREIPEASLDRFVDACHEVAKHGLVRCSCGNLSMRLDEECFLVTATGSWMSNLTRDQVAVCSIENGNSLNDKKPSSETGFHAGILRSRPDVNVVLHFQTPCATTVACQPADHIDFSLIPEVPFYIGPVARVPYFTPGSGELAAAVTQAMATHDMVLLSNHGQVTAARDFDHVLQNAEFFELACEIILLGGKSITPLTSQAIEQLQALRSKTVGRAV
ncbi:MAG TPA: class II aldolase/adducin family protein [Sulfuricaulis sp.]|nr:class II aldolase/adducin family protein [Sulfuricaulis sp.]